MTRLVLEKILEYLDWKSVLTLRQVCQRLRYQIDEIPYRLLPDNQLTGIRIFSGLESIRLALQTLENCHQISYSITKNEKFSRTNNSGKEVEFKKKHLVNMMVTDLEQVLRFQKSPSEEISISFHNGMHKTLDTFPDALRNALESRNQFIRVKRLQVIAYKPIQIMCLLPCLDANCLEEIQLCCCSSRFSDFDMNDVVQTEQWNNAKKLYYRGYCTVPLQSLSHFSRLTLADIYTFSAEDMDFLKTAFSRSSNFEHFDAFLFKPIRDPNLLSTLWGPPITYLREQLWHFQMSNTDDILRVKYDGARQISMKRVNLEIIPNGVVIYDN